MWHFQGSSSNGGREAAPVEQWALQGDRIIWCLQPCGLTESESIFLLYGTRAVSENQIMKASFFPCISFLAAPALAVLQSGTWSVGLARGTTGSKNGSNFLLWVFCFVSFVWGFFSLLNFLMNKNRENVW